MRNIDLPGAKEIFAKQDELMATFWVNKGWVKANLAIYEAARDDYFDANPEAGIAFDLINRFPSLTLEAALDWAKAKMKVKNELAHQEYLRREAAYYEKYGTVGEF